jgi:hypothetical protein
VKEPRPDAEAMGNGAGRWGRPDANQRTCRKVWKWHQDDLIRISGSLVQADLQLVRSTLHFDPLVWTDRASQEACEIASVKAISRTAVRRGAMPRINATGPRISAATASSPGNGRPLPASIAAKTGRRQPVGQRAAPYHWCEQSRKSPCLKNDDDGKPWKNGPPHEAARSFPGREP